MAVSSELRRRVKERANNCCEYCRLSQSDDMLSFHVDYIIAQKHGGDDTAENLCLACYRCNGFKGSNVASIDPVTDNATRLYNPRDNKWDIHFDLLDNGLIEGKTPEGRVTVLVLRLNDSSRLTQRTMLMEIDRYPCDD